MMLNDGRPDVAANSGQAPEEITRRTACAVLPSPVPRSRSGWGRRRLHEARGRLIWSVSDPS